MKTFYDHPSAGKQGSESVYLSGRGQQRLADGHTDLFPDHDSYARLRQTGRGDSCCRDPVRCTELRNES